MKTVLGLDSSSKTASVCLKKNNAILFDATLNLGLTHSETLLTLVDTALRQGGIAPKDIDLFAITSGPGSFTGLRIGMALIKGMALPFDIPVAPISTLEALAYTARPEGIVVPALDARRNEVYWAAFEYQGGIPVRIQEDSAGPAAEISTCFSDLTTLQLVGDGAAVCCRALLLPPIEETASDRSIAQGAVLAAMRIPPCPAGLVAPSYLRMSQAERQRAEAAAKMLEPE